MNSYIIEKMKDLIVEGFFNIQQTHKILFDDPIKNHAVVGYLAVANSQINSARAIYACNYEELANQMLDDFFHRFAVLTDGILENIHTDQRHQRSDIEFRRLLESYEFVKELLFI